MIVTWVSSENLSCCKELFNSDQGIYTCRWLMTMIMNYTYIPYAIYATLGYYFLCGHINIYLSMNPIIPSLFRGG